MKFTYYCVQVNHTRYYMKKTIALLTVLTCIFMMSACTTKNNESIPHTINFTDALGRKIYIGTANRIGAASGSFAKIWTLAGGTLTAVTRDVFSDETIKIPEDIIDLGSLKDPSVETILSSNLDVLFLVSGISSHVQIAQTLEKAGVQCVFIDIETFDDYLQTLDIFTDITGRKDLYQTNGLDIRDSISQTIVANKLDYNPKVLLLRASESKVSVRDSSTMAGNILKDLGCINIADSETSLLTDLSVEAIISQQPEYVFVVCMGEFADAKAQLEYMMQSNPIWFTLDAVKNNKILYLDKELFHLKPTTRWGESYEIIAKYLSEE